jgi:hypothetical protein
MDNAKIYLSDVFNGTLCFNLSDVEATVTSNAFLRAAHRCVDGLVPDLAFVTGWAQAWPGRLTSSMKKLSDTQCGLCEWQSHAGTPEGMARQNR